MCGSGSGCAHRFLSQDPLGGGYAYVGDSPANFVDPSGNIYGRPGGGGVGQSRGAFDLPSSSPYTVQVSGDETTQTAPAALSKWETGQCFVQDTMFAIGLVLDVLGLYFESAKIEMWAAAISGLSMATDIPTIINNWQSDPAGTIGALVDLGWNLLTSLIIPSLNLWDAIAFGAEQLPRVVPLVFAGSLLVAVISSGLAFASLVLNGCIPPLGHALIYNPSV